MVETQNIFEWLENVRDRRSMYARSLADLENIIYGYYTALSVHRVCETVPRMTQGHFGVWLREKTGWSLSAGWAHAIEKNTNFNTEAAFQKFFAFVDEYRTLQPTVTAAIELKPEHQPTGKRSKYGHNGLMDRPDEILAINYSPTSLNHLRHRYNDFYVDDWMLMLGNGSHKTSLSDLMEWVADEFDVNQTEWTIHSPDIE